MGFISWIVIGLIAGFLARLLVPGKDPMGILGTLVLGLLGSIVGGLLLDAISDNTGVGIIGSTVGAVVVLLVYRMVIGRRSHGSAV